jgi:hypothetical protein
MPLCKVYEAHTVVKFPLHAPVSTVAKLSPEHYIFSPPDTHFNILITLFNKVFIKHVFMLSKGLCIFSLNTKMETAFFCRPQFFSDTRIEITLESDGGAVCRLLLYFVRLCTPLLGCSCGLFNDAVSSSDYF